MHSATVRLLLALLLVHAMGPMAAARDVRVEVVFGGPPSRTLEVPALKEARLIWAAYGVDVSASHAGGCEPIDDVSLSVTLAKEPDRGIAAAALGSIRFQDGVPEPAIVLYPPVIAALVSSTQSGNFLVHSPGALRDLVLGRVLGRALAHEIGHFLLRTQQHSTKGLMRALQPTADLVDPNRHRFQLSAADVSRLAAVRPSFVHPSGPRTCGD
jgi:hypothetical protein